MPDKLNELSKRLRQTRDNSEAALRRYAAIHPKIERIRDIFDDVVPFEMEFSTDENDMVISLDLYFNKPPPLNCINHGQFALLCENFTVEISSGFHLIQLKSSYYPGSVTVFTGTTQLSTSQYNEYDPVNGLVYIVALDGITEITICYLRNSWAYRCPETDPLAGTTFNDVYMEDNYSFFDDGHHEIIAANTGSPTFTSDPYNKLFYNFISIPQFDMQVQVTDHTAFWAWYTHLGSLANLPIGNFTTNINSNMIFIPTHPATMDWHNFRCTLNVHQQTGTSFDKEFDIFIFPYERLTTTIRVGSVGIQLDTKYQDRAFGQSAGGGAGRPPRTSIAVYNFDQSNMTVHGDTGISPGDNTGNEILLPWGEPIPIVIENFEDENRVFVIVGDYSFNFPNPYFMGGPQPSITVDSGAYTAHYESDSNFFCKVLIESLTPCGLGPTNG